MNNTAGEDRATHTPDAGSSSLTPTPQLIFSPRLLTIGVPHCFTTRKGGYSGGIFSSLNFGNPSDIPANERDPRATIERNFTLVTNALQCPHRQIVQVHQMHGADVHLVEHNKPAHPPHATETGDTTRADAIVTNDATRLIAIRTADCAPILLADESGKHVAAVHAGWRGLLSGVLENTIATMKKSGTSAITAAIGPCISHCAFEVGPEVKAAFEHKFPDNISQLISPGIANKYYVNIVDALVLILNRGGITSIDAVRRCTYTEPDYFFSHRRDDGRTGRMVALIGPR